MSIDPRASQLVYLNLASDAGRAQLREDPLVSDLQLPHRADDPRLLIALGEISGSSRPLSPKKLTRLPDVLILWLDEQEWLVLPHGRYGHDLEQALHHSFGAGLSLELIPDGTFQAELGAEASAQLGDAETRPLNHSGQHGIDHTSGHSVCIRPWTTLAEYDLLLTRADMELLQHWLTPLQH